MVRIETRLYDGYAVFRLAGTWTSGSIGALVAEVDAFCTRHGIDRVLVDARPLARPPSETRRHQAGAYIAEHIGSRLRIAIVYHQPHVSKMLEHSAVNRGARVLVTASEREALDWLLPAQNRAAAAAAAPRDAAGPADG